MTQQHPDGVQACDCIRPMNPVGSTCLKCGGIVDGVPERVASHSGNGNADVGKSGAEGGHS